MKISIISNPPSLGPGRYKVAEISDDNLVILVETRTNLIRFKGHAVMMMLDMDNKPKLLLLDIVLFSYLKKEKKDKVLEFIFAHEMGHYKSDKRNISDEERNKLIDENKISEVEAEADRYAINLLGKDVFNDSIETLIDLYNKLLPESEAKYRVIKELKLRKEKQL